tara:strand:- start:3269 stop:3952 length:684 start_codon:yes stop_codon:yes gene_type:complete
MGKLNVLVLGDGMLGSELVRQTGWSYVCRSNNTFDTNSIASDLVMYKPDVIVNCIANTDTYSTDKQSHWDINYSFVDRLTDYCNSKCIKLVHISTDYLYTDSKTNASELDIPVHCNNWYGYTKLLSDGLVQLRSKNYLICRCTHKPKPFPYESAWIDQVGNFDYVDIISGLIIKLIKSGANGVYNVGTEVKTMYELATTTNREVSKSFTPEYVPKNQSMNIDKLNKI